MQQGLLVIDNQDEIEEIAGFLQAWSEIFLREDSGIGIVFNRCF